MRNQSFPFSALLLLAIAACSSNPGDLAPPPQAGIVRGDGEEVGRGASGGDFAASERADAPTDAPSGAPEAEGPAPGSASGGNTSVPAGILTAGAWDDNRNLDLFLAYRASVVAANTPGVLPFAEADHRAAAALFEGRKPAKTKLDVALLVDTTGSMGDEMQYLQSEFLALHATIAAKYPNAQQRWSLVVYKDESDPYVVRWFDFREDPQDFRTHLAAQSAGGGGDFPEAVHRGLEVTTQLNWRAGDAARLVFWLADAPHHAGKEGNVASALRTARARDLHVYPVASSGIDELTELSMRSAAQLTGGRYIFLTSDSGVGGSHKEPSVPCYFVTKLDRAIVRMVDVELTGEYREPDAADVLRTGGTPTDGRCTLEGGGQANVF